MKLDVVVLSPHLDDAVLSLGQHMIDWCRVGKKVKVITIFSGFGKGLNLPQYSRDYVNKSGFDKLTDFELARTNEDKEVMESLGVEYEHWGFVDGGFRGTVKTREELLGGTILEQDRQLVDQVGKKIKEVQAEIFMIPYGVGGHVDHIITRKAGEAGEHKFGYYLELPYLWQNFNYLRIFGLPTKMRWPGEYKDRLLQKYSSQYKLLMVNQKWPLIEVVVPS